jgi:hypothetical protein
LTIQSPAPVTITSATLTYNATAANQTYGSANTSFSGTVTGFAPGDNQGNATTGALAFTSATTTTSPVGSYAINGSGLSAANYTFVQAGGNATALMITKAGLSITASPQSKTYGTLLAFGSSTLFTSSGLSNSQTIGSVTLVCSGGAANVPIGSYTITPSAATDGTFTAANYNISYVTNTLTVNPLPVILTGTRPYDGTSNVLATVLTISNNLDGPNLAITGSGTLASASVGGPYAITALGGLTLTGTAATNYTLTGSSSAVTITLAVPTVTCPTNVSDTNLTGQCGNTESFVVTTNDTGGLTGLTYTIPGPTPITSPFFFPVGTTTVTAAVTNAAGTNSCTFTVTILDITPPVPVTFSLGAVAGTTSAVPAGPGSKLLLLASTPITGGTLSIASVNPLSAMGGLVTLSGGNINYAAPASTNVYSDTITYTLSDGCGTATGTIAVSVSPNGPGNNGLTITPVGGGCILLQFFGIPGQSYYIQQTSSLNLPVTWTDLVQTNANSIGVISDIICPPLPSPSFYRTSATP